jgi:hypothetical protein
MENKEEIKWHYAIKGAQHGPVSSEEIESLIKDGKLTEESKVWKGEGEWVLAKDTELAHFFKNDGPPPLTGSDIDNKFVWMAVSVPVIGSIIGMFINANIWWVYICLNILACGLDMLKLEKAGQKAPVNWSVFLVPVYLWKRASILLHKNRIYFWAWCVSFIISIVIDMGYHQIQIENSAQPIVSQILKEDLYTDVKCKKVTIQEEISEGLYKAKAILNNGQEINITIEEVGDKLRVSIPLNQ